MHANLENRASEYKRPLPEEMRRRRKETKRRGHERCERRIRIWLLRSGATEDHIYRNAFMTWHLGGFPLQQPITTVQAFQYWVTQQYK